MTSRAETLRLRLETAFSPLVLRIENQSDRHLGHAGHDGTGETHFDVYIVSASFEGVSRVERQKRIYATLGDLFQQGLHALALTAKTPQEVQA